MTSTPPRSTAIVPDTVLFDLDGTLVDSAPGILGSLRDAFTEVGVVPAPGVLGRHLLGPPLYSTLPRIIGDDDTAAAVFLAYRRHYDARGVLESHAYPGIDALLHGLAESGAQLALATSKAESAARAILELRGWTGMFSAIVGDSAERDRPTKTHIVAEVLNRIGGAGRAVMVGDRSNDVIGSRAHGISCLGAGWGYGDPGELETAGAVAVFDTAEELASALPAAFATS